MLEPASAGLQPLLFSCHLRFCMGPLSGYGEPYDTDRPRRARRQHALPVPRNAAGDAPRGPLSAQALCGLHALMLDAGTSCKGGLHCSNMKPVAAARFCEKSAECCNHD